jgi:hypothetical protein
VLDARFLGERLGSWSKCYPINELENSLFILLTKDGWQNGVIFHWQNTIESQVHYYGVRT